jgi:hypothetical protein
MLLPMTAEYAINNIVIKNPNAIKLLMSIASKRRIINGVIATYDIAGDAKTKSHIFLLGEPLGTSPRNHEIRSMIATIIPDKVSVS